MWTDTDRNYYFNDNEDNNFKEKYCTALTITQLGKIDLITLKTIIKRITEIAPNADHSSPIWNKKSPIISFGKVDQAGRIKKPRCGLSNIGDELYFWTDRNSAEVYGNNDDWTNRWNPNIVSRIFYKQKLETYTNENHPLNDGSVLCEFLKKLDVCWENKKNTLSGGQLERIQMSQNALGLNINTTALTPKLISMTLLNTPEIETEKKNGGLEGGKVVTRTDLMFTKMKKNSILFGPPGTGKTYSTVGISMIVFDDNQDINVHDSLTNSKILSDEDIKELREGFEEKMHNGEIVFTSFHQNFSYEDFIEGIRVKSTDDGKALYETRNGVFKKLARKALFYKIAGSMSNDESKTSPVIDSERFKEIAEYFASTSDEKINGLLNSSNDTNQKESETKYNQLDFEKSEVLKEYRSVFNEIKAKSYRSEKSTEDTKKFVLIIDEINRGNISKIFGELITLIEDTKRYGSDESLSVTLPYSQESFFVPDNLYIIGTMNTADRSLATLDIALRRRFQFIEMMPQPSFLNGVVIGGIDMEKWLTRLNENIQILRGREFTLGHAFFKDLKNEENPNIDTLAEIMRSSILPLLDEYFFEDWEGIRDVLGVTDNDPKLALIIRDEQESIMPSHRGKKQYLYRWNPTALTNPESYIRLYKKSNNENVVS